MPSKLSISSGLMLGLIEASESVMHSIAQRRKKARALAIRGRSGLTLRPGAGTPLWNELVSQVAPFLTRRGGKARLARFLGLPRQRLHDCLKSKRATLDAERTLLLACWVSARQQGRDLNV